MPPQFPITQNQLKGSVSDYLSLPFYFSNQFIVGPHPTQYTVSHHHIELKTLGILSPPSRYTKSPRSCKHQPKMVSKRIQTREDDGGVAEYEKSREERIKQNLQRMQSLGIVELSRNLKPPPKPIAVRPQKPLPPSSSSPRRSSRIKILPTVCYTDSERPTFKEGMKCHQCRIRTTGLCTKCCKCSREEGQFCGNCLLKRYGENVREANANPGWICPVCRDICNCRFCRRLKGLEPIGDLYKMALRHGY